MSHIVARIPNAVLWIVGEGEQRKSIEEEVAALGLGGNIRLLGNRYDVAELLFASDAFILTSVSEGIPLTLIEAMLSGVPCVCTDVGGIPEVLENGETGLLAKARDAAGLGNAVVKVISDSLLADRLTRSAYAVASEKFSATKMHDAYSSIYTDMLRRSSASRATRND
jgi:glycosyltransferase involved in cell wall biosynthesis